MLLALVEREAFDERNFVKKAVNWALRNIGKRDPACNAAAVACAVRIRAAADARAGGPRGGDAAVARRALDRQRRAARAAVSEGPSPASAASECSPPMASRRGY